jgi:hypothetical protein
MRNFLRTFGTGIIILTLGLICLIASTVMLFYQPVITIMLLGVLFIWAVGKAAQDENN